MSRFHGTFFTCNVTSSVNATSTQKSNISMIVENVQAVNKISFITNIGKCLVCVINKQICTKLMEYIASNSPCLSYYRFVRNWDEEPGGLTRSCGFDHEYRCTGTPNMLSGEYVLIVFEIICIFTYPRRWAIILANAPKTGLILLQRFMHLESRILRKCPSRLTGR